MDAFARCFLNTVCANDTAAWHPAAVHGIWLWSVLRHRQLINIQASLSAISGYVDFVSVCLA